MTTHDTQYLDLINHVLRNGTVKGDRTGTGTISVFDHSMRFDLSDGTIPLLTTKKVFTRMVRRELLWFISGDTNIEYLVNHNVPIWNEWPCVAWLNAIGTNVPHSSTDEWKELLSEFADKIQNEDGFAEEYGDLGPVYGAQWRRWQNITGGTIDFNSNPQPNVTLTNEPIDQLAEAIETIKTNPDCRRIIVNSWNVGQIDDMALPPCHYTFQFYTAPMKLHERVRVLYTDEQYVSLRAGYETTIHGEEYLNEHNIPARYLSCKLNMRSTDVFLGLPFNIVQYSILTRMIAQITNTAAKDFIYSGGDVHIYSNHIEQCKLQASRQPLPSPSLKLNPNVQSIDDFTFDDIEIVDYNSHPAIVGDVAI